MREVTIEKAVINICAGNDKQKMDRSRMLIEKVTGKKAKYNVAKKRIATWAIRQMLPIGYKVTLRGKEALEFVKKVIKASSYSDESIDRNGNFSFGINEYLDIPGMKYDSDIGVLGFEVMVTMKRPGIRIKHRRLQVRKVPQRHRVTREETAAYIDQHIIGE